jgi:FAD:protein FMN transferase
MKSLSNEIRRARPLLGTIVEIGVPRGDASTAIEAAFREIETIHRLMSFHDSSSDISRLNRSEPGEIVHLDHRTHEVLAYAQLMSQVSAGAFDVTVGGKLSEENFLPKPAQAKTFDSQACFQDLVLLPNQSITLTRRAWIDVGGIAKGYAVDRAVMTLKKFGVVNGIVNAGGDLSVFGAAQPVHVRHPENPSLTFPLGKILNSAVASSSGCFNDHADVYQVSDPLVDPRRNRRLNWRFSVTVIAPRCIVADALTKVVRLAIRRAPRILSRFRAWALIIDRGGLQILHPEGNKGMTGMLKAADRVMTAENLIQFHTSLRHFHERAIRSYD